MKAYSNASTERINLLVRNFPMRSLVFLFLIFASPNSNVAKEIQTKIYNNPLYNDIASDIGRDDDHSEENKRLLTLNEAILLAMKNNPELEMSLEREKQASYAVDESKSKLYPQIVLRTQFGERQLKPFPGNFNGDRDSTEESMATLQLNQLLFDGYTSIEEAKRRQQVKKSSEIETEILMESVISDTIKYYFSVLRFQKAKEEAARFILEMQIIMDKISIMQQSGAANMIELDFAKARLASAKSEATNATASFNDAVSNLEFLVGDLPPFRVIEPADINDYKLKALEYYIQIARINNSEIRLAESTKKALKHRIKAERGKYMPTINLILEGKTSQNEGGVIGTRSDASIILKANVKLYDSGKRRAAINRVKSQYREVAINDRLLLKELDKEVKLAYNQVSSIRQSVMTTDEEVFANERLQQLNHQRLALGEVKIIELIEVEERLFQSKNSKHKQVSEHFINYFKLMTKAGLIKKAIQSPTTDAPITELDVYNTSELH